MGYVKMNCPSCGGNIEYNGNKDVFFCEYCGTRIVKDKQFVELSGSISVSGIASKDSLLERAFLFLEDQDFASANEYLEQVLDMDPKCAKAYIGKLMCLLHICKEEALSDGNIPLTKYPFYNKAIRFASSIECQQYEAYNQVILDRLVATKEAKQAEIDAIKQRIAELKAYLEDNKKQNIRNVAKKALWRILLIISICCVVFWTIGTIVVFPLIIFNIPFIICMICTIRLNVRAKKTTEQYESAKHELANTLSDLSAKEASYNNWLQNNM